MSNEEYSTKNCQRGDVMQKNKSFACNVTSPISSALFMGNGVLQVDDSAWKLFRKIAPQYQKYDNVVNLG